MSPSNEQRPRLACLVLALCLHYINIFKLFMVNSEELAQPHSYAVFPIFVCHKVPFVNFQDNISSN